MAAEHAPCAVFGATRPRARWRRPRVALTSVQLESEACEAAVAVSALLGREQLPWVRREGAPTLEGLSCDALALVCAHLSARDRVALLHVLASRAPLSRDLGELLKRSRAEVVVAASLRHMLGDCIFYTRVCTSTTLVYGDLDSFSSPQELREPLALLSWWPTAPHIRTLLFPLQIRRCVHRSMHLARPQMRLTAHVAWTPPWVRWWGDAFGADIASLWDRETLLQCQPALLPYCSRAVQLTLAPSAWGPFGDARSSLVADGSEAAAAAPPGRGVNCAVDTEGEIYNLLCQEPDEDAAEE